MNKIFYAVADDFGAWMSAVDGLYSAWVSDRKGPTLFRDTISAETAIASYHLNRKSCGKSPRPCRVVEFKCNL